MNRELIKELEEQYLAEHPGTANTVEPFVYDSPEEIKTAKTFPFPPITDFMLSEDWFETEKTWFVDSWGGQESGPALSQDAFRQQLYDYAVEHPDHGFGISGVGQFQIYVTAYRPVTADDDEGYNIQ